MPVSSQRRVTAGDTTADGYGWLRPPAAECVSSRLVGRGGCVCSASRHEIWGDMGRYGEIWGDTGRCSVVPAREEMWGDMGRYVEIWGDLGRDGEMLRFYARPPSHDATISRSCVSRAITCTPTASAASG